MNKTKMNLNLITIEDLKTLKEEIILELKQIINQPIDTTWLKSQDVKKILGCSEGTLIHLRASGALPYCKIGGTIYIRKKDVDRLFESNVA
jgi:hypothetical protein